MNTVPLRQLVAEATEQLGAISDAAGLEARRLVEHACGHSASELHFVLDRPVTIREVAHFDRMLARRMTGEPLQYVLGAWGFRQLELFVDRRVLIPRPETETVVGVALDELDRAVQRRAALDASAPRAVDLGTGSGAIALSVAFERPSAEVWATDVSADALDVARANLAGLGRRGTGVRVQHGDWFEALDGELRGTFDLVISNPPYVAHHDELPALVRDWEPVRALIGGPTGLEAYETIVPAATEWLRPTGVMVLEVGATQADAVCAIGAAAGFGQHTIFADLSGRARTVVLRS